MLNGVDGALTQCRFAVGQFHTDVEGRYGLAANLVLARYVYAALQAAVVDGEAWYLFHCLIDSSEWVTVGW